MGRRQSIFAAPALAFFSRDLYDDVARRWGGVTFAYLLLLLAVTWAVWLWSGHREAEAFLADEGEVILSQIPRIIIDGGRVSADRPQPYYIRYPKEDGKVVAIIDTTGQITSLDGRPETHVLLTENKLHVRQSERQVDVQDLSGVREKIEFDGPTVRRLAETYLTPVFIAMFFLALISSYLYRIVQALIYGAIGLAFASAWDKRLDFAATMRLAIMAVTPVILADTVLGLAGVTARLGFLWWLICLGIAMAYLAFGVSSVRREPDDDPFLQPGGFAGPMGTGPGGDDPPFA